MSKAGESVEEELLKYNIPTHNEKGEELTKTARKKLLQKAKKDAKKEEFKKNNQQKQNNNNNNENKQESDISEGNYGVLPRIQSQSRERKVFHNIRDITQQQVDEKVFIRARLHTYRGQGNLIFITLRQRESTIQAVGFKGGISRQMVQFIQKTTVESIIDVEGTVKRPKTPVVSTTQQDVEIEISKFFVVTAAQNPLPILLEDAERPLPLIKAQKAEAKKFDQEIDRLKDELAKPDIDPKNAAELEEEITKLETQKQSSQKYVVLSRPQRLNNRVIDLRTTTNQAIFKLQSGICQLYREYLLQNEFTEIHSPKLIGTASEGGANVFSLNYFGKPAYLAQSPQLYKQMAISSDFNRVFEIAPVFRAEEANTPRHMTEFIGLDLEMAIYEHYHEILDLYDGLFVYIFENIPLRFAHEIEVIKRQYPFEDFVYHKPSLRLQWKDAVRILREAGEEIDDFADIGTIQEKKLGQLVKEQYKTDFYMLDKFPLAVRPFYTMPDPDDPRYSNSYDFFIRGQEILSGAQRIHEPELLSERAKECDVSLEKIKDYIDAFRFGAFPHGGGGIGLERVVMLYLNLANIQTVTLFPRTPSRLFP